MKSAALLLLSLSCAFAQGVTIPSGPSVTTINFTRSYSFPPVGLGSAETAQVNVVNNAVASTAANAVAPSCTGTIVFTNAAGKQVGSTQFTTTGNQIFSAQLTFSALATSGTRAEFVATVQVTGSVPATSPCSLVSSLETFNTSTNTTDVFVPNATALGGGLLPVAVGHN